METSTQTTSRYSKSTADGARWVDLFDLPAPAPRDWLPRDWLRDIGRWFLDAPADRLSLAEADEWARVTGQMGEEVRRRGVRVVLADGDRNASPLSCPACGGPWEPACGCRPREGFGVIGSYKQFREDWARGTVYVPDRAVCRGPTPGSLDVRNKLDYLVWHDVTLHGDFGLDFSHTQELVAHFKTGELLRPRMSPDLWEAFVNMSVASVFADHITGEYVPCCNKVVRGRAPTAPWLY